MNNNIKVIDEHNIDRVANKLFAVDVDGSSYFVYSISRDEENDNIFVSKLIHNINNTYSMVNIDDNIEKENLTSLVKELIKYAVDLDDNKLSSPVVPLSSGKDVSIISVIIDSKEQSINVAKTYITTVKKTVSKVTSDFYDISIKNDESIFSEKDVFPIFETNNSNNSENTNLSDVGNDSGNNDLKKNVVESVPYVNLDNNNNINLSSNNNPINEEVMTPLANITYSDNNNNNISSSISNINVNSFNDNNNNNNISSSISNIDVNSFNDDNNQNNEFNSKTDIVDVSTTLNESFIKEDHFDNKGNDLNITSIANKQVNDDLVFDASKETNLNAALDEVSSTNSISNNDLNVVREFGSDNVNINNVNVPSSSVSENNININKKDGFASSKFLGIFSILMFLGVCCFMAYEIFNYMHVAK